MLTFFNVWIATGKQAGKVKASGKYNFAYMRTQDCRQLKTKKHKKRPTGFTAGTEQASSSGVPTAGEATGGPFPLASIVKSGNRLTAADGSGNRPTAQLSQVQPAQLKLPRQSSLGLLSPRQIWFLRETVNERTRRESLILFVKVSWQDLKDHMRTVCQPQAPKVQQCSSPFCVRVCCGRLAKSCMLTYLKSEMADPRGVQLLSAPPTAQS
eukprot:3772688-Amphidinium_carterae.1